MVKRDYSPINAKALREFGLRYYAEFKKIEDKNRVFEEKENMDDGKGAYPMYIMNGVINSFCENGHPKGLRDIADNPLICGVYTWSRGGGWYGPYIKNEF